MAIESVSGEFFDQKYRADRDPWKFASSPYELNRYAEIIRALGPRNFDCCFEPGCSIGVLTERLAARCKRLIAMDISPAAVALAQERCRSYPHVTIVEGSLPDDLPAKTFDLIVFSEIGYYFERDALAKLRDALTARLAPSGVLLAAHWLGVSEDHLLSGDQVHEVLRSGTLRTTSSHRYEGFVLESWERN